MDSISRDQTWSRRSGNYFSAPRTISATALAHRDRLIVRGTPDTACCARDSRPRTHFADRMPNPGRPPRPRTSLAKPIVGQVIHVNVETVKLVGALPAEFEPRESSTHDRSGRTNPE